MKLKGLNPQKSIIYPAVISTFMSRINFMHSRVEHEKSFITSGPCWSKTLREGFLLMRLIYLSGVINLSFKLGQQS